MPVSIESLISSSFCSLITKRVIKPVVYLYYWLHLSQSISRSVLKTTNLIRSPCTLPPRMPGRNSPKKRGGANGRGRKTKGKAPPPLSDLDKSRLTREKGTTTQFGSLHPSIGVLYLPWCETEDGKLVMFIYPNNHNTVNPKKVIEIMNNLANNPMQILNTQPRDWGTDEWYNWYHHDRVRLVFWLLIFF